MADVATLPLRLSGASFRRQGRALLGPVDLTLGAGPRTVIMGPNGAGKSLLLRLCHGLLVPSDGEVRCGDAGAPTAKAVRRRQAMVFQRPVMLRRSVLANITYALALRGIRRRERRRRAEEALALVGLESLAGRTARVLSGGEQQRLALARAWVLRPDILFLDEPTSALDPHATQAVEVAVQRFHEAGTKIVMTTHNIGQARRLADEVVFLDGGRIVERGPAERFLSRPETASGRHFLAGELGPGGNRSQRQWEENPCPARP
ncbi:ATP-binding cassette domain-containing protein [Spiribacter halobius]|uniref:ABC transporter ATP-binding protein n=1 Tax=Sediminicurvatus halobius TaxID=2182432 RepID=A0A2U2MYY0_9GAMM|nr:ATP-binding cassette domain-containing protein [Spiribacter halobius]PWG62136.1 ABC transporter ATP-binding protein [Spiribacter halobius]UEX77179.1 ATP-binding cassette domain-containing protein [Spiribacter halobius]